MKQIGLKHTSGFTLIEIMVTLAIVAIVAVLSVSLYSSQIRTSRRADGLDTINSISLAEEKYRTNNVSYGSLAQVWGGVTSTTGGYYTLSITNTSATGYTITATAVGNQANDTQDGVSCTPLVLTVSSGTVTKTPTACWPQ